MGNSSDKAKGMRGFLTRLARDVRGNTLAIMAMSLIPLAGMVGGGVDISRMYILKTRLQHACDAGALAGRRAMGGGTWSYNSYYPRTQADQFFDANFDWEPTSSTKKGEYGSYNVARAFTESAGKVTGNVEATIPMTLMKIFLRGDERLQVTCDAEMRLPNTDVMFVLDTTGSMAEPQPGDTVNKMSALKTAVKCFYEIVARLDTDANCTTGTPSGGTGNQVQIRFGFVPYATNVNVGRLLKPEWFADSWKYQTREAVYQSAAGWVQQGNPTVTVENVSYTNTPQSYCNDSTAATLNTHNEQTNGNTKTVTDVTYDANSWANTNGGTCYGTKTTTVTTFKYSTTATQTFKEWRYAQLPVNVSLIKNGTTWKTNFQWPVGSNGSNKTIGWEGCVEERQTVRATDYDPIPAGAKDLNIDLVPTSGDVTSQWGMVLPDVTYTRNGGSGWTRNESNTTADYGNQSYYACPVEAKKLQAWTDANAFDTYVDQLAPEGNTYHDIGLIWGARLMSAGDSNGNGGLFASENKFTPQGGEIERHMIFMTDGDACTGADNYTAYGISWFDRRQTADNAVPTGGCTYNSYTLTQQVNLRTEALCAAIKNKNITLWVIAFGNLATETEDRLETCASNGRYFKATNAAQLQQTFKSIADQISMLRLTN